jgi:SpoVK/Ycf46/Vps4 family AAA+-type ATPase
VSTRDLRVASRRGSGQALSGLARRLEANASFDELVVPHATRRELELALEWARRSATVFRPDGAGRRMHGRDGLVCLFHGPPGTGKTMAARVIAATIDADLLRVDLSQVVNKYIGETEKNLDRVFDEAESTGSILFFDEADALFGKRSEVKDAHDRYANIETAFLLQRLEIHAFTRRIHVSAEFPAPGREERMRIWELQFPPECLGPDVDLAMLADRANLTGGDIRNAAATAAVLAAGERGPVAMQHLVIGTWRELRKSGRLVSADVFGAWKDALLEYTRGDIPPERS